MIIGNGRIGIAVEFRKLVDIIPSFLAVRMEDMGTVAVHLNALYLLGVDIAANVTAPLQHQNGLSVFLHLLGKCRAIKPCTHHKIIIMHDFLAFPLYSQTVCHDLRSGVSIITEKIRIVNHSIGHFAGGLCSYFAKFAPPAPGFHRTG